MSKTALSKSTVTEIINLHEQLGGMVKATVALVWRLGEKLTLVKDALDFGHFGEWIAAEMPFSHPTANRYMKVYQKFPAGITEDMNLSEAYLESGVKRLGAPELEPVKIPKEFRRDGPEAVKAVLRMPVKSTAHLKKYRVAVVNNAIQVVRPGWHDPLLVGGIHIDTNEPELLSAKEKLEDTIQAAMELFLEEREQLEDNGMIAELFDPSPVAEVERVFKKKKSKPVALKEDA